MKTIDVVAAIICHEGRVFATQRGYGDHAGGWEFPGGKIEEGESPEDALVREIREELDVRIGIDSLLTVVDHDYDTFHLHMDCFLCHLVGDFELHEHLAARWVGAADIDDVAWLPADTTLIEELKQTSIVR